MKRRPSIVIVHYAAPPVVGGVESTIAHHARQRYPLPRLAQALNRAAQKRYDVPFRLVSAVEARFSRGQDALQMVDVLIGAVGYHLERLNEKPGAKEGKVWLAAHIANRLGETDLTFEGERLDGHFCISRRRPQKLSALTSTPLQSGSP